jgi:PQQ-dependent catabolism-associated CXXCW motif protein
VIHRGWRWGVTAALLASAALAQPSSPGSAPPEPDEYRAGDYRAPTPSTLKGATVLTTEQAEALWRAGRAAFVDVLPRPKRPANLPAGTLWHVPTHASIPGALWLPNVGFGALAPETEAYFEKGLEAATQGDRARPIVIFCQRDCWMSWNAAKRAVRLGYASVAWFPDGTDGWGEAGLPLQPIEPRPES